MLINVSTANSLAPCACRKVMFRPTPARACPAAITAAPRCLGQGLRRARLRHRHQGARDAARPHDPTALAGAVPVVVDESSVRGIPGVGVVRDKGFISIVAERERDALQAAERLKVTRSDAAPPFPEMAALYDHIPAFAGAARVVEAEHERPFQSHAGMGPAGAVVDARAGAATLWTGSQKEHSARGGVARVLGLPRDQVDGI